MLVSPQIEKDLFEGKCEFKTINFAFQNSYTIPVPKGSFIIIREINWNQFATLDPALTTSEVRRNFTQMSIVEKGKSNELVILFKNFLNSGYGARSLAYFNDGGGVTKMEVWKVFRNDAVIDLVLCPDMALTTYTAVDKFKSDALEREQPLAYGTAATGLNLCPLITFGGERFYQTGERRQFVAAPFINPYKDRIRFNTIAGSIFFPILGYTSGGLNFPSFTVSYFEYKTVADQLI